MGLLLRDPQYVLHRQNDTVLHYTYTTLHSLHFYVLENRFHTSSVLRAIRKLSLQIGSLGSDCFVVLRSNSAISLSWTLNQVGESIKCRLLGAGKTLAFKSNKQAHLNWTLSTCQCMTSNMVHTIMRNGRTGAEVSRVECL